MMSSSQKLDADAVVGSNSFRQTHQLLGAYPFASATPSTHVARHLSSLSLSATPPSYSQSSYSSPPATYGHTMPYQTELSYISSMQIPRNGYERDYWDASRNDMFQIMADQSLTSSYPSSYLERDSLSSNSSYQLAPFAQSVMHHGAPYNAYPTPPPASTAFSSSSSSLANALGSPTFKKESKFEPDDIHESKSVHEDPSRFFDDFLDGRLKELQDSHHQSIAELQPSRLTPQINHDPGSSRIGRPSSTPPIQPSHLTPTNSPKKRKMVEVLIETPRKQCSGSQQKSSKQFAATVTPVRTTSIQDREGVYRTSTPSRTQRVEVYVEIPPSKDLSTPSRSRLPAFASSPDLGGYGPEDGSEFITRNKAISSIRSTGKRTGERDDRVPLEKFLNLVEEIFEADDNVSPELENTTSTMFFSQLSSDPARPLLHSTVITRLAKAISKVARPVKRVRLASVQWEGMTPGSPRKAGGMAEVDIQILIRLLKLLERSVQAGEDLEPFGLASPRTGKEKMTTQTKARGPESHNGNSIEGSDAAVAIPEPSYTLDHPTGDDVDVSTEVSAEDTAKLERSLELALESVLAADCCIALLTSDRLVKQLYSEDLIASCLSVIKNTLVRIVYPFVEAPSLDTRSFSPLLMHISGRLSQGLQSCDLASHRLLIGDIFQTLSSVFPRINSLICSEGLSMPESIIIPAVYIAIGPFFVVEGATDGETRGKKDTSAFIISQTLGSTGMRGLRLEALSLVRSIFTYHEDQRSWIIEEILTSLVKLSDSKQKAGVFRLRDGRSIRTVSALLLQLVQTSAHSVRVEAHRIAKARQQQLVLKRHDSSASVVQVPLLEQLDIEETSLYTTGLEAPTKAAKAIVMFLTQRSGKGKSTKNTNEMEYRAIFDNLISDLLVVLFWPEWPAAGLVLGIICKYMISALDDVKSTNSDNNASKALALDHLGVIAGRLRSNLMKWSRVNSVEKASAGAGALKNLEELVSTVDVKGLEKLITAHQEVASHLAKRASEDHAYESARELNSVVWGQELAIALIQLNDWLARSDEEKCDIAAKNKHTHFLSRIKATLQDVWKDAPMDVFDNTTQEETDRAHALSEQLGATLSLRNAFDPILNVIVLALDAPAVFVRTKALRALSHILTVDSSVLSNPNVRDAIESHLLDSSPQVRDAAVELIGKYMIDSPAVAGDYYQKIAERIADTGIGVRKRVIKLLKSFYCVTDGLEQKIDICSKLVLRMLDEDDTVKDLSVKTLEELWFPTPAFSVQAERRVTLATTSVVMSVCSVFKDRQSPLEDILFKMINGKEGSDESATAAIRVRFTEIYDAMLDGLVDSSDFMNFTIVNCVRAIYLFTSAFPSVMTGLKASVLLPYLKSSASNEDVVASDYILKIYRISIPHMTKTSLKFGHDLQVILQPMVLKPNIHGTSLQEIVACLCVVVQHLTHEYSRLVALLKSCLARLRQFVNRPSGQLTSNDARTLHVLVVIVSLLGEHFDFDRLRSENAELSDQIDTISQSSIVEFIHTCLLHLYDKYTEGTVRGRLLVCMGCLFRARPTLMTLESSASLMDAIFVSSEDDNRARLLKIMQEFLISESAKHSSQNTSSKAQSTKHNNDVDMEELVGNTRDFAESGVSSAVVQRYLNHILEAALSPSPQIQSSAVDILSFTVKQGLAHPLLSFPVIVALETSPISSLSARAVALHTVLHHKHTSLLNSGFIAACRKSYDYQSKVASTCNGQSVIRGFRMQPIPTALLGRWYALVREKRATRQEFLRAVLKVFEIRDISKTDEDEIHFIRYMAENFASFEYRSQEEILTVVKTLTRELAETGALLVERVAPGNLLSQLRLNDRDGGGAQAQTPLPAGPARQDLSMLHHEEQLALMRSSCVVGVIMILRAYLKDVYGLSEEKCQKFVIGKKSAIGDRPAIRRKDDGISWNRMPFATKTVRTSDDVEQQRMTFLEIWNEDGAAAEPEGDEWE